MFELLSIVVFVWLLAKAAGLAWKLTWGVAKAVAGILMGIAVPLLVVCLVFVGGAALFAPIVLIAIALAIVTCCT